MKGFAGTAGLILLAAMAGCGDDNPVRPLAQQPTYLPSSTPLNVLENMRRAYQRRDSTAYDSLFDDTYAGVSTDMANPGAPLVLNFNKSDERAHMGRLASERSIISIDLDFGASLIRFSDPGDEPWTTMQSTNVRLEINGNPNSYFLASTNELIEFKFVPTTPSPGSQTDTTWHIIRWTEIHQ